MTRFWLTALGLAATLATAAQAETVHLPESGDPAFTAQLPDGWTHETFLDGSLKVFSPNHTAAITLVISRFRGTPDELAAAAIETPDGTPPQNTGAVVISGYSGSRYEATVVDDDVRAKVHMLVVRVDDGHMAVATLMTADNLDAAQTGAAVAVLNAITLTKVETPPPPPPPAPPAPATPATPPAAPAAAPTPATLAPQTPATPPPPAPVPEPAPPAKP